MRRAPSASGLSRFLAANKVPAAPDAADMGTAYGLEMSLEAGRPAVEPAAKDGANGTPALSRKKLARSLFARLQRRG